MLFVRKSREQLLIDMYEARLAERDRLVRVLAEQVEYQRALLQAPTATVGMALAELPAFPATEPVELELVPAFGDSQDELEAMRQAGVITEDEYQIALSNLTSGANIIE